MNTELFIKEVKANLEDNILRFWSDKMKNPYGGFHGRMRLAESWPLRGDLPVLEATRPKESLF